MQKPDAGAKNSSPFDGLNLDISNDHFSAKFDTILTFEEALKLIKT